MGPSVKAWMKLFLTYEVKLGWKGLVEFISERIFGKYNRQKKAKNRLTDKDYDNQTVQKKVCNLT